VLSVVGEYDFLVAGIASASHYRLVPYFPVSVIKNKENLNHRGHREHREIKKKFFSLCPLCSLWWENMIFWLRASPALVITG